MIKECIHKQDLAGIIFVNRKKKKVKEGGERKGGKGKLSVQLKSERKILVNEAKLNKLLKILL